MKIITEIQAMIKKEILPKITQLIYENSCHLQGLKLKEERKGESHYLFEIGYENQSQYNKLLNEYQENIDSYSELIRSTKESDILEMQNRIQTFQQNASQQLQQRGAELMCIYRLKTIPLIDAYLHSFFTNEGRIKNDRYEYKTKNYSAQIPGW